MSRLRQHPENHFVGRKPDRGHCRVDRDRELRHAALAAIADCGRDDAGDRFRRRPLVALVLFNTDIPDYLSGLSGRNGAAGVGATEADRNTVTAWPGCASKG